MERLSLRGRVYEKLLDAGKSETYACERGSQEDQAELHFWWGVLDLENGNSGFWGSGES